MLVMEWLYLHTRGELGIEIKGLGKKMAMSEAEMYVLC
jgi:hypothetical protein